VKIKKIVSVIALVTLLLAASGRAEASPKPHFLKSKKFWYTALAIAVPGTISGVLATQGGSARIPVPTRPGISPSQPKPKR